MTAHQLGKVACLLVLLLSTCGCMRSADQLAEEERLHERIEQLNNLKESIKELPRLQYQLEQAEAENKKLRAQLKKKRHR